MPQGEKKTLKVPTTKKNATTKTKNSVTKKGKMYKPSSNPQTQKLQQLEKVINLKQIGTK
jgi:hypothetical protein